MLPEPDRGPAPEVIDAINKTYLTYTDQHAAGFYEVSTALEEAKRERDYDQTLAEAIRNAGNVVLGYSLLDPPKFQNFSQLKHKEKVAQQEAIKQQNNAIESILKQQSYTMT